MSAEAWHDAQDRLSAAADRIQSLADAVVPDLDGNVWYSAPGIELTLDEPDGADATADSKLIELGHPDTWVAVAAWLRSTAAQSPHSIPAQKLADRVLKGVEVG